MKSHVVNLTYKIELLPGEKLSLPDSLIDSVGEGHWLITIEPYTDKSVLMPIRKHSAFLESYAPEDEGLYDDYPVG